MVVETSRGWQLGRVVQILAEGATFADINSLKPIDRKATPRDLLMRQSWQQKEAGVVEACQKRVRELRLSGVKIIAAEYSFDGSKLAIMYSCETEDKVDLKSLRQDMQKLFNPVQVEMRQVGPRDVAKMLGGMGACGLETRCCSRFLCDFNSISIRMAKEQGVSLTPSEITGMCGRLRCCLIYEYDTYLELRKGLPKKKKRVITPAGEGKVVDSFPLRGCVMVEIPEVGRREFRLEDIIVPDEANQNVEVSNADEENIDGEGLI
ncbi:MAG: regulatory iron-sulfur-containing complex subunit RicT [Anaerolineales bacterium]